MTKSASFEIRCERCHKTNVFQQPYAYHAGFSDQGFLYDDAGTSSLIWSLYDTAILEFSDTDPHWLRSRGEQKRFEDRLPPSPSGGAWRFTNPARCVHCGFKIAGPMFEMIYYLVYPTSIVTDSGGSLWLGDYMLPR